MLASLQLVLVADLTNMNALLVTGSIGEGYHMTIDERKKVAEAWIKAGKEKYIFYLVYSF